MTQPRQDTTGAADTVATDPGVTSYRAPSQPKPEAKVDLLENKGGEEERMAWQQQLEAQKAQKDSEFRKKLESIKNGGSPAPKADFRNNSRVSLDPYGGSPEHTGSTRDRLAVLKQRFDKALN